MFAISPFVKIWYLQLLGLFLFEKKNCLAFSLEAESNFSVYFGKLIVHVSFGKAGSFLVPLCIIFKAYKSSLLLFQTIICIMSQYLCIQNPLTNAEKVLVELYIIYIVHQCGAMLPPQGNMQLMI